VNAAAGDADIPEYLLKYEYRLFFEVCHSAIRHEPRLVIFWKTLTYSACVFPDMSAQTDGKTASANEVNEVKNETHKFDRGLTHIRVTVGRCL